MPPIPILRPVQRVYADADAAGGSARSAAAVQDHSLAADRRDGVGRADGAKETQNGVDSVGRLALANQEGI